MGDSRYELDRDDRIVVVNGGWREFARANGAAHLAHAVVGTAVWEWMAGVEVEHLYRLLFARVRKTGRSVTIPFRCDSPDARRFMELEICALPAGGLRCSARIERLEPRRSIPFLDSGVSRSDALVAICSWCKRVREGEDRWLEIEDASSRLGLLLPPFPGITHSICPQCVPLVVESE